MLQKLARGAGGAVAGAAAWLAFCVVAIEPSSPTGLVAIVPSWWWLAFCVLVAVALSLRFKHPSTAILIAPAVVALPWIGKIHPTLLLWNGTMCWLVWILVAIDAIRHVRLRDRSSQLVASAPPVAIAAVGVAVLGLVFVMGDVRRITGDEPHYLIATSSVLRDFDLDLTNDYDLRRHLDFYAGSLEPRHTVLAPSGRQYSFHGVGPSIIALPAYAIGGVAGTRVLMLLVSLVGVLLCCDAARRVTQSGAAVWATFAALVLQIPFAAQSSSIYPDGPAATIVAFAVWVLVRAERDTEFDGRWLPLAMLALAALPWLHIRLAMVAGLFGAGLLFCAWRRGGWSRVFRAAAGPLVIAIAWFGYFAILFETWDPTSPFRQRAAGAISALPTGTLGLLVDQEYGILPYAPALVFALLGIPVMRRLVPVTAWCGVITAAGVVAIGASYVWWGGTSSPARFLVPMLPVAACFVGAWWTKASIELRAACTMAFAVGGALLLFGAGIDAGRLLVGDPDGAFTVFESLNALVDISASLPSLFRPGTTAAIEAAIAAAWGAVALAGYALVRQMRPRSHVDAFSVSIWTAIFVISAGVGIGWAMRGGDPRTPDRSRMALLQASGGRWRSAISVLSFSAPGRDKTTLLHVPEAPPGRYRIHVHGDEGDRDRSVLRLHAGRDGWPLFELSYAQNEEFTLVAPVHSLWVGADAPRGHRAEVRLEARPLAENAAPALSRTARTVTRYGRRLVYSFDDASYMESGGFWTAADRATQFLVADLTGTSGAYALEFEAGPSPVTVRVTRAGAVETIALDRFARHTLVVDAQPSPAPVIVDVDGGFSAAAALQTPDDGRTLGVWIAIRDASGGRR